ncbi:MAG: extracellular solute-binding protein, partial [Spirochaetia bacterium]|nr:extracellular solute-binding protein [Spirochaetia bacterium]
MKRLFSVMIILISLTTAVFAAGQRDIKPDPIRTVTWWHPNSGLAGQATQAMVQAFNSTVGAEKNIRVEAVYQGKANDVLTKAKAILQSDSRRDLPDLAQLDGAAVLDIRDVEALIAMEDLALSDGYDLGAILEAARLSVTYKNKMIAMPFNSSTILLYYNKTAFDQAGISRAPRTLDELAVTAQALVQKDARGNVIRSGFANVPTTYELI